MIITDIAVKSVTISSDDTDDNSSIYRIDEKRDSKLRIC